MPSLLSGTGAARVHERAKRQDRADAAGAGGTTAGSSKSGSSSISSKKQQVYLQRVATTATTIFAAAAAITAAQMPWWWWSVRTVAAVERWRTRDQGRQYKVLVLSYTGILEPGKMSTGTVIGSLPGVYDCSRYPSKFAESARQPAACPWC